MRRMDKAPEFISMLRSSLDSLPPKAIAFQAKEDIFSLRLLLHLPRYWKRNDFQKGDVQGENPFAKGIFSAREIFQRLCEWPLEGRRDVAAGFPAVNTSCRFGNS